MLNPVRFGLFSWQLASHKLCRWLVPFAMLAAFAANALLAPSSVFYEALFFAQIGFYAAAIAGLVMPIGALRLPSYLLAANMAVLAAWFRFARGERMATWRPSERTTALPQVQVR
jgi:hypothetical protein